MQQDSSRVSSLCLDGQWQRDPDLGLGLPEPGSRRESKSIASLVKPLRGFILQAEGGLRVLKQRNDMIGFVFPLL